MVRETLCAAAVVLMCVLASGVVAAATPDCPVLGVSCNYPVRTGTYLSRMSEWTGLHIYDTALVAGFNAQLNGSVSWLNRDVIPIHLSASDIGGIIRGGMEALYAPFDVTYLPPGDSARTFAEEGLLRDLGALWDAQGWDDTLNQGVRRMLDGIGIGKVKVPNLMVTYGVYYRKSVLVGFEMPPASMEDLFEICDAFLASGSPGCFAVQRFPVTSHINWYVWFDNLFLRRHGHRAFRQWVSGQLSYTEDERIGETFRELADLLSRGIIDASSGLDAVHNGTVPFALFTEQVVIDAPSDIVDDIDVFSLPVSDTSPHQSIEVGTLLGLAIPANARYPDFAESFLAYALSPEIQSMQSAYAPFMAPVVSHHPNMTLSPTVAKTVAAFERAEVAAVMSIDLIHGAQVSAELQQVANDFFFHPDPLQLVETTLASLEALRVADLFAEAVPPTISVPSGSYNTSITVELSTLSPNASVYYTLDGSYPFEHSLRYTEPIVLSNDGSGTITVVLRCVSVSPNLHNSNVERREYHLRASTPSPPPAQATSTYAHPWVAIGLGISAGAVVLALCVVLVLMLVRARGRETVFRLADDGNYVIPFEDLQLLETVGRGGFGSVYRGLWCGVVVAVKQQLGSGSSNSNNSLHPNAGGADVSTPLELGSQAEAMRVRMFIREAAVMVRLRHPYVVTMLGICVEPTLCLVTEFMERGSLFSILQGPIEIDVTLKQQWALQIAQGLAFLHGLEPPILHRDLKSLNVLVDRQWVPKLADFGLSSLTADDDAKEASVTSRRFQSASNRPHDSASRASNKRLAEVMGHQGVREGGTVNWTAPEVLLDVSNYTAASDVYSYAILVWEIATRAIPFEGRTPMNIALAVALEGARPEATVPDDCFRLTDIFQGCWAQQPRARVPIMRAVEVLRSYVSRGPVVFPRDQQQPRDMARAVLVAMSLESIISDALKHHPHAYVAYFRGLRNYCTRTAPNHDGLVWQEEASILHLAFPSERDAMSFISAFANTPIQPVLTPLTEELAGLTQTPLDLPAVVLPCALSIAAGAVTFSVRDGNKQQLHGQAVRDVTQFARTSNLGELVYPSHMSYTIRDAMDEPLTQLPALERIDPGANNNRRVKLAVVVWQPQPLETAWVTLVTQEHAPIAPQPDRVSEGRLEYRGGTVFTVPSSTLSNWVSNSGLSYARTQSSVGRRKNSTHAESGGSIQAESSGNIRDTSSTQRRESLNQDKPLFPAKSTTVLEQEETVTTLACSITRPLPSASSGDSSHTDGRGGHSEHSGHSGETKSSDTHAPTDLCLSSDSIRPDMRSPPRFGRPAAISQSAISAISAISTLSSIDSEQEEEGTASATDFPSHTTVASSQTLSVRTRVVSAPATTSPSPSLSPLLPGGSVWVVREDELGKRFPMTKRTRFAIGCTFASQAVWGSRSKYLLRYLLHQPSGLLETLDFAEIMSSLALFNHPNLLPMCCLCLDHDSVMVMVRQVIPGGANVIRGTQRAPRSRPTPKLLTAIVSGTLAGLVYLERMGLMYGGNLKPSCILVDKTGHVFLTDWGLHHLTDHGVTMTAPQDVMYMAPECLNGTPASIQSDVYAFGCIVLELYSTEPLFARNLSGLQLAMAISEGTRPTIPSGIPPHVSALVSACFAEPEIRPSFAELETTWNEFNRGGASPASPRARTPHRGPGSPRGVAHISGLSSGNRLPSGNRLSSGSATQPSHPTE